jgi:hypothetical protein
MNALAHQQLAALEAKVAAQQEQIRRLETAMAGGLVTVRTSRIERDRAAGRATQLHTEERLIADDSRAVIEEKRKR